MATLSSVLAWRIPGTEKTGFCPWDQKESDMTEQLTLSLFHFIAAAAAKLLQSCLTLCDPIDGSPPGSPIPGIL